ncbi:MAG TPA: phosphoglycerate mutase family protein [Caulobacteraceae bacterium]|jgi:phosphohistidine phosphatase SixA
MARFLLTACAWIALGAVAHAQTVVLVRHAEKAAQPVADPPLTDAGVARARALAQSLEGAGVDLILTSPLQRTIQTAAVLEKGQGVPARQVGLGAAAEGHSQLVADQIRREGAQAVVLVVGHSNTIPAIAKALGFERVEPMSDCEYDRMIVLRLTGKAPRVIVTRYGAPSPSC